MQYGAKYGFSISEQRNRNTWLQKHTDDLIKDRDADYKAGALRRRKKNSVGQNGNYPDRDTHTYVDIHTKTALDTYATIYQSAGGVEFYTFYKIATDKKKVKKNFAFVFESVSSEDIFSFCSSLG